MAWLSGYSNRKSIPITGATGAGTGYVVTVTINSGSGSDGAGVVYLNNLALHFPYDVVFTASDGSTKLPFFRRNSTTFDVRVTADLGSNQSIYVYYVSADATDYQDGGRTYDAFLNGNYCVTPYASNPCIAPPRSTYTTLRDPSNIVTYNGVHYVVYNAWLNDSYVMMLAKCTQTSPPFTSWTDVGVCIGVGAGGQFDSKWVQDGGLIIDLSGGKIYCYYGGGTTSISGNVPTLPAQLGVAYQTLANIETVPWTRSANNPLLALGGDYAHVSPSPLISGGVLNLFYSMQTSAPIRNIHLATATLGNFEGPFTKYGSNPLVSGATTATISPELPWVWYSNADACFYMIVTDINDTYGWPEQICVLKSASIQTTWDLTTKRILYKRTGGSYWDSSYLGSFGPYFDPNTGELTGALYDAMNSLTHLGHSIGWASVRWSYNELWDFPKTFTSATADFYQFQSDPGYMTMTGRATSAHGSAANCTHITHPLASGDYVIEAQHKGTWDVTNKKSEVMLYPVGTPTKTVYSGIMYESSASPFLCSWLEYGDAYTGTRVAAYDRNTVPSFPATRWIRLTKIGNVYTQGFSTDGVTFNSTNAHFTHTMSTVFDTLGATVGNDNGATAGTQEEFAYILAKRTMTSGPAVGTVTEADEITSGIGGGVGGGTATIISTWGVPARLDEMGRVLNPNTLVSEQGRYGQQGANEIGRYDTINQSVAISSSGGGVGGGTATVIQAQIFSTVGGGVAGGSSPSVEVVIASSVGGGVAGGSATVIQTVIQPMAGGGVGGGSAVMGVPQLVILVGSGGGVGGGSAAAVVTIVAAPAGGGVGGGSAIIINAGLQTVTIIGSGGAVGGGSAVMVMKPAFVPEMLISFTVKSGSISAIIKLPEIKATISQGETTFKLAA